LIKIFKYNAILIFNYCLDIPLTNKYKTQFQTCIIINKNYKTMKHGYCELNYALLSSYYILQKTNAKYNKFI